MISLLIVDEVWVLATLFASRIGDEGSAEPSPVNDFELTPITIGFLSKLLFRDKGGEGRMLYFEDLETDEWERGERSNRIVASSCCVVLADMLSCPPSRFSDGKSSCVGWLPLVRWSLLSSSLGAPCTWLRRDRYLASAATRRLFSSASRRSSSLFFASSSLFLSLYIPKKWMSKHAFLWYKHLTSVDGISTHQESFIRLKWWNETISFYYLWS